MPDITEKPNYAVDLGKRIRMLRKYRGMFQEDLASKCGFSRQFLSLIEVGKRTPSVEQLHRIAECLESTLIVNFAIKEFIKDGQQS